MNLTCTYTQSEKLLRQYYYNVKMTGIRKWGLLGLLMIAGSVALYISSRDMIDLIFLVLGVGLGIKEAYAPYGAAKKDYAALGMKYGADLPQTTVTLDDKKLVATFDGEEKTLLLADVLGIYLCKDSIVVCGYSEHIIIAHEGLEDLTQWTDHLKKHCKNAPIRKR